MEEKDHRPVRLPHTTTSMTTHQAFGATAKGVLGEFTVNTEQPGPDEVLIQNFYATFNPIDVLQLDFGTFVPAYPYVLGASSAGRVAAVGSNVKDLQVGDRVRTSSLNF